MICHTTTAKERCLIHHRQAVFNHDAKTDNFSQEKYTHEGMAVIMSAPITYKRDYLCVGWSCLRVIQNRNASEMWVTRTLLEVQS